MRDQVNHWFDDRCAEAFWDQKQALPYQDLLRHTVAWLEPQPGEHWLDIRRLSVLAPIMKARLDLCAVKGFDGVEFYNVDGYQNRTGFPLTANEQLTYDTWLANQEALAKALDLDPR